MAIQIHPQQGTIVICDFSGLNEPEMTKRRLAIVLSPFIRIRPQLCCVVPLSTTAPNLKKDYHCTLIMDPPLPEPYNSPLQWVKGDMVYTMALSRLFLPTPGKTNGKRDYDVRVLSQDELMRVQKCVLVGMGLSRLTQHLE
ncbi:type II toxin-antitoxin system PemK/MazF family toxin [Herminiimonas contaminans]|uniref:Type II toxin-antitoxin system PemK/MazF family toxin n=1 Tax=Herminiimonas contaminans TaxID=1111140 RepID=A0ABS0ESB1_9BURK|nr:type II toxin-antitoxin system PemK/MazF family toxin [Herminiimonas contaminans]MBF8177686.1 type II toxin-antitoxin system PemK/MazF family toxin [Herminiimonas contaminans]